MFFAVQMKAKLIRKDEGKKKVTLVSSKKSSSSQQPAKTKLPPTLSCAIPKPDRETQKATETVPEAQDESLDIILSSQGSSGDSSFSLSQESSISSASQLQSSSRSVLKNRNEIYQGFLLMSAFSSRFAQFQDFSNNVILKFGSKEGVIF